MASNGVSVATMNAMDQLVDEISTAMDEGNMEWVVDNFKTMIVTFKVNKRIDVVIDYLLDKYGSTLLQRVERAETDPNFIFVQFWYREDFDNFRKTMQAEKQKKELYEMLIRNKCHGSP
jgi:hypothetical protein